MKIESLKCKRGMKYAMIYLTVILSNRGKVPTNPLQIHHLHQTPRRIQKMSDIDGETPKIYNQVNHAI